MIMHSVCFPLFWWATRLAGLTESCGPDKTMGNKQCAQLEKIPKEKVLSLWKLIFVRPIATKTSGYILTVHDCESVLLVVSSTVDAFTMNKKLSCS